LFFKEKHTGLGPLGLGRRADKIESLELVEKLVSDAILGLDLDRIIAKNV